MSGLNTAILLFISEFLSLFVFSYLIMNVPLINFSHAIFLIISVGHFSNDSHIEIRRLSMCLFLRLCEVFNSFSENRTSKMAYLFSQLFFQQRDFNIIFFTTECH